jgi:hypothetical protein
MTTGLERVPENSQLRRARAVARLLDSSIPIPGTGRRIGIDPILGLIPFVGDFGGAILSGYIVLAAAQAGAPTVTLIRMIGNVGLDSLVGAVPLLGDLFDAAWKANSKNVALLERHVADASAGNAPTNPYRLVSIVLVISAIAAIGLFSFVGYLVYLAATHSIAGR